MDRLSDVDVEIGLSQVGDAFNLDEKMHDYYENLGFYSNGNYDYQSHRLIRCESSCLPNSILNLVKQRKGDKILMGIFEAINRIYVCVDNLIYLWDFSKGQNGSYLLLPSFSSNITCIALVNVKPNVLINEICHVLVVATENEICLMGLGFEGGNICNGEMKAYPTHYIVATDDSKVCKIIGDPNGRIYMGCHDGKVFEFQYSFEKGYFGRQIRKMKKVAFPDAYSSFLVGIVKYPYEMVTSLFSGLGGNNNNETNMNDIGAFGNNDINRSDLKIVDMCLLEYGGKKWIFTLNNSNVLIGYTYDMKKAILSGNSNNSDEKSSNDEKIPTFAMIHDTTFEDAQSKLVFNTFDANNCQLIKIDSLTNRLSDGNKNVVLMGVSNRGDRFYYSIISQSTRYELVLECMRLRPPQLELSDTDRQSKFEPGITSRSPIDIRDTIIDYDGRTVLMSDHRSNTHDSLILISRDSILSSIENGKLHESIECETISQEGSIISIREMPYSLYVEPSAFCLYSRNEMRLSMFGRPFKGLTEMAIQHALPPKYFVALTYTSVTIYKYLRPLHWLENILLHGNEQALQYFFDKYTIEESEAMLISIVCNNTSKQRNNNSQIMLRQRAFELFWVNIGNDIKQINQNRLSSINLFFSRIMRSLWHYTLCVIDETNNILPRYTQDELQTILEKLITFHKHFIDSNESKSCFMNSNDFALFYRSIQKVLQRCIETLHVLTEFVKQDNWVYIIQHLGNSSLKLFENITFEQLSMKLSGEELIRLILQKLSNRLSSETVKRLHRDAGLFFNTSDFLTFLAKDSVKLESGLETGLEYLKQACNYDRFDIREACKILLKVRYYNGIIELIFHRCDVLSKRRSSYEHEASHNEINYCDQELKNAWDQLFNVLTMLVNNESGTVNNIYDKNSIDKAINMCLQQKQQDFLFRFYEWLLENGKLSMIFKNQRLRYFEDYLITKTNDAYKNNLKLKQLVLYYETIGDYGRLVEWLNVLASKADGFSLEERYNFLLRGKHCIQQQRKHNGLLKHDNMHHRNENERQLMGYMSNDDDKYKFGEKLLLCQIQMKMVSQLSSMISPNNDEMDDAIKNTIATLQSKLENLDCLYNLCINYKLHECGLDCLSVNNSEAQKKAVNSFWFAMIKEIVRDFSQNNEWMDKVEIKLINVSKNYDLIGQAWMLSHSELVPFLEQIVIDYASDLFSSASSRFVIDTMLECKISLLDLIYDYSQLLDLSNDATHVAHIIECIIHLVTKVTNDCNVQGVSSYDQTKFRLNNPRLGSAMKNSASASMALVKSSSNDKDIINASRQIIEACKVKLSSNQAQFAERTRLHLEKSLNTMGHVLSQHTLNSASLLFR